MHKPNKQKLKSELVWQSPHSNCYSGVKAKETLFSNIFLFEVHPFSAEVNPKTWWKSGKLIAAQN